MQHYGMKIDRRKL